MHLDLCVFTYIN